MKYLLLIPPFILVFILKDMAMLLKHQDLLRGLTILVLISFAGIFFTAWLNIARSQSRVMKKIGSSAYKWLESEDE